MTEVTVDMTNEPPTTDTGVKYPEVFRASWHFKRALDALEARINELVDPNQSWAYTLSTINLDMVAAELQRLLEVRDEVWAAIDPARPKPVRESDNG